jgi:hypothetical protein
VGSEYNRCMVTIDSLGVEAFSGAGRGSSIVTSSSGLLRSMIMMDKGRHARKRMLLAAKRWTSEEGGVY